MWKYERILQYPLIKIQRNQNLFGRANICILCSKSQIFFQGSVHMLGPEKVSSTDNHDQWNSTESIKSLFSHPGSIVYSVLAIWKNTDRPRRQVVMHIPKSHFCKSFWIIIGKECSASSRFWFEYMSLYQKNEILCVSFSCEPIWSMTEWVTILSKQKFI